MEIIAEAKYIKMSPRKVRLVAMAIKKLTPVLALSHLALMPKQASKPVVAALKSAMANAINNAKLKEENLRIKAITVAGGPALKRWRPVSRGRAHPYKKRMSHIRVVLSDEGISVGKNVKEVKEDNQGKLKVQS